MRLRRRHSRTVRAFVALAAVAAMVATMSPSSGGASPPAPTAKAAKAGPEKVPDYDARRGNPGAKALQLREARIAAKPSAGVRALRRDLGAQGIVQVDPLTRTPRIVAKTNGYLTARSSRPARVIALGYVRSHPGVFRLSTRELARPGPSQVLRRHLGHPAPQLTCSACAASPCSATGCVLTSRPVGVCCRSTGRRWPACRAASAHRRSARARPAGWPSRTPSGGCVRPRRSSTTGSDRSTTFRNGDEAKLVLFQTLRRPAPGLADGDHEARATSTSSTPRPAGTALPRNMVQSDNGLRLGELPRARPTGGAAEAGRLHRPRLAAEQLAAAGGQRRPRLHRPERRRRRRSAGEEITPSGNEAVRATRSSTFNAGRRCVA